MERFLERHSNRIIGTLIGFDRVLFRGSLLSISYVSGLEKFLSIHGTLHKEFGAFAQRLSGQLHEHAKQVAEFCRRPYQYLKSSAESKEDVEKNISKQMPPRRPNRENVATSARSVRLARAKHPNPTRQRGRMPISALPRSCAAIGLTLGSMPRQPLNPGAAKKSLTEPSDLGVLEG